MDAQPEGELAITSESDIVAARRRIRNVAADLGFGVTDVTRIVTTVSELSRNIYQYAGEGVMRWQALSARGRVGLQLRFEDDGPGIADIGQASGDGYSSGKGLGLGIPGSRRLMDELEITSEVGRGTVVIVRKWRRS